MADDARAILPPRTIAIPEPTPDQAAYLAAILAATPLERARDADSPPAPPPDSPEPAIARQGATLGPVKRWPFAESPGDLAKRIETIMPVRGIDMLSTVRSVLIEDPPALAAWLDPGACAKDATAYNLLVIALRHAFTDFQDDEPITTERILALGKTFTEMVLGIDSRHDARISELLAANNAEVERRRTAERDVFVYNNLIMAAREYARLGGDAPLSLPAKVLLNAARSLGETRETPENKAPYVRPSKDNLVLHIATGLLPYRAVRLDDPGFGVETFRGGTWPKAVLNIARSIAAFVEYEITSRLEGRK